MMRPKVIGLAGRMGSGKNAAGRTLEKAGYEPASFACALRQEVQEAISRMNFPTVMPYELSLYLASVMPGAVWEKPTPSMMRKALQWWGTEYRRSSDRNYWVRRLLYSMSPDAEYVITDVRFGNEADAIREIGGVVIGIERPGDRDEELSKHESEALRFQCDFWVKNDGTLKDLERKIRAVIDG